MARPRRGGDRVACHPVIACDTRWVSNNRYADSDPEMQWHFRSRALNYRTVVRLTALARGFAGETSGISQKTRELLFGYVAFVTQG